ncbi:MAG: hypothetical protein KatS3mg011_0329 [Acidimicrobiia bacterium]|nr:MAG: hypothetical protein KatS3mg011_0329 [Acidimicrobiia bacterium]
MGWRLLATRSISSLGEWLATHDSTSGWVQQPARAVLVGAGLVVLLSAGAMAAPVSEAAES